MDCFRQQTSIQITALKNLGGVGCGMLFNSGLKPGSMETHFWKREDVYKRRLPVMEVRMAGRLPLLEALCPQQ